MRRRLKPTDLRGRHFRRGLFRPRNDASTLPANAGPHMNLRTHVAGAILGVALGFSQAAAEPFPSKPIKIIVPYAVGGATDLITRLVAQYLSTRLGVSMIVENRAGGGGPIATKAVAMADPDGYTLLTATNGPFAIGPAIYRSVGYDPIKSFG